MLNSTKSLKLVLSFSISVGIANTQGIVNINPKKINKKGGNDLVNEKIKDFSLLLSKDINKRYSQTLML